MFDNCIRYMICHIQTSVFSVDSLDISYRSTKVVLMAEGSIIIIG